MKQVSQPYMPFIVIGLFFILLGLVYTTYILEERPRYQDIIGGADFDNYTFVMPDGSTITTRELAEDDGIIIEVVPCATGIAV